MDDKTKAGAHHHTESLGKWYSWDTPTGLSLGFSVSLISLGLFIFLLHKSGLF